MARAKGEKHFRYSGAQRGDWLEPDSTSPQVVYARRGPFVSPFSFVDVWRLYYFYFGKRNWSFIRLVQPRAALQASLFPGESLPERDVVVVVLV